MATAAFDAADPLNIQSLLTDDEVMIQVSHFTSFGDSSWLAGSVNNLPGVIALITAHRFSESVCCRVFTCQSHDFMMTRCP